MTAPGPTVPALRWAGAVVLSRSSAENQHAARTLCLCVFVAKRGGWELPKGGVLAEDDVLGLSAAFRWTLRETGLVAHLGTSAPALRQGRGIFYVVWAPDGALLPPGGAAPGHFASWVAVPNALRILRPDHRAVLTWALRGAGRPVGLLAAPPGLTLPGECPQATEQQLHPKLYPQ